MDNMNTVVQLIINPVDYDLGMDLMWAEGLDYDKVMQAVAARFAEMERNEYAKLHRHRGAIETEYVRWAGAIHPEGIGANSHRIQAFKNLGYN